jgi:hypothetical protein
VERRHRLAEPGRVPADLVERCQPAGAVERRVLDALGLHGAGILLELHRESPPPGLLRLGDIRLRGREQHLADEPEDGRLERGIAAQRLGDRPVHDRAIGR